MEEEKALGSAEMWAARDKSGNLKLYRNEPFPTIGGGFWDYSDNSVFECIFYSKDILPEITYDNSPRRIKLTVME